MCLRKKAGSTKASAIFLDSLDPPGCLKKAAFKVDKMMRKLFDPPAQEPDTWYGRLWSKGKLKVTQGFVPLLKTSSFIFDYVKDGFFFYYAVNKIAFITSSFIKGLIIFHGTTILASGVLMGMVVQMDRALINLDNVDYPSLIWPLRIVIFVATPVVPVVVILRALNLTTSKRKLESEWTRNQESTTKLYLKHNKLDKEKRKVMKGLANIKIVEVSTEGVPQLYILIVLIISSADPESCIGLLDQNDPWEITFLVLSLLHTYTTIILSTIASTNIKKHGQMDFKSKILLLLSISFQLAAKLWIMGWIAYCTFRETFVDTISPTSAVLLLVLPILTSWFSNLLLHARLNTDFHKLSTKEKLIHLLSTTWFTLPVRRMEDRDQRHKGREVFWGLLLAGLNLLVTSAALGAVLGAKEIFVLREALKKSVFLGIIPK